MPERAINLFRAAEIAYRSGKTVVYDFSGTKTVTETFISILISHIKDPNINKLRPSKINLPTDKSCNQKLRKFGIFKKVDDTCESIDIENIGIHKLTNTLVANDIAKQVVRSVSRYFYNEDRKLASLYSILIELMANTNNHADSSVKAMYPWWLYVFVDENEKLVKFVFLDLGLGIYESMPVKQHITVQKIPLFHTSPEDKLSAKQKIGNRERQIGWIQSKLESGDIKSSTKNPSRGRGMPHILKCAKSGDFRKFNIISNDAYVDVIGRRISAMRENFSGTIYYFELQEKKDHER